MSKIKLTKRELDHYGIGKQLDDFQRKMSAKMGLNLEFEPFDGVSDMMKAYIASKSQSKEPNNEERNMEGVSDMMKEYLKSKKISNNDSNKNNHSNNI